MILGGVFVRLFGISGGVGMTCVICGKRVRSVLYGAHLQVHFIFGEAARRVYPDGRVEYVRVVKEAILNGEETYGKE